MMSARDPDPRARARGAKRARARSSRSEFARIETIGQVFSSRPRGLIKLGIGDDAAVLAAGNADWIWTVDSSVQDVHFRFGWLTEADIGWKSFQAAVSDLAAMGASPVGALSALELPKSFSDRALNRLLDGQKQASKQLNCPVIGGNLAAASALAITTTVLGRTKQPLLRSGARIGDEVWLVGDVGLARAGLLLLLSDDASLRRNRAAQTCIHAWRRPVALVRRGLSLVGRARAAIDVSDGLIGDAGHIANASRVAVEIDLDALARILSPSLIRAAELLGHTALDVALRGGEDYALLATGPYGKRPRWARTIGRIAAGTGVWGSARQGGRRRLRSGFDHFGD
jgi:thiamine-monophosphate kinase